MDIAVEPVLTEIIVVSYDGDFSDSGKYEGVGFATMDNECTYEGNFQNGLFHGTGRFTWPNNVFYEGDFKYGQLQGNGMYEWADGSVYEGIIKDGKRHGAGIFKCSGGQVYEGEWKDGKRHGKGVLSYNVEKSIVYTGSWAYGLREGYGQMKYASGNIYEGEWRLDRKCGRGAMSWKSVDECYIGDWVDDKPNGFGEHIWADNGNKSSSKLMCNMYRGQWSNGLRHGPGSFFYSNGSQYSGNWANNYKEGEGVFIHPDGKIFVGEFLKDRIVAPVDSAKATPDIHPQMKLNIEDVYLRQAALSSEDNEMKIAPVAAVNNSGKTAATLPVPPIKPIVTDNADSLTKTLQRTTLMSGAAVAATQSAARATLRCINAVAANRAATESQTHEIERLLLRYASQLRSFYRRCCEIANRKRAGHLSVLHFQDKFSSDWCKVEHALYTVRNIHSQFYCMTLDQMRKLLRDLDICGPYFNSYDLLGCLNQMNKQHQEIAQSRQMEFRKSKLPAGATANVSTDNLCVLSQLLDHGFLGDVIDATGKRLGSMNHPESTHSLGNDPRQPILERQFGELLVRCIATYSAKKGSDPDGIYYATFRILAEKFEPLCNDRKINLSPFMHAYYADSVQDCIKSFSVSGAALNILWKKLIQQAKKDQVPEADLEPVIQLKQLMKMFTRMKDAAIKPSVTMSEILLASGWATTMETKASIGSETMKPNNEDNDNEESEDAPQQAPIDLSCLGKILDFDDFVLTLCRIILSNVWNFHTVSGSVSTGRNTPAFHDGKIGSPPRTERAGTLRNLSAMDDDFTKVATALREKLSGRLISWLNSFEQNAYPI